MIHPDRAPVKPRVISPETGDAILLEDVLLDVESRSGRIVEIVGGIGSGKTMALAYLAATAPPELGVVCLDDALPRSVVEAAGNAVVAFTAIDPRPLRGAVS